MTRPRRSRWIGLVLILVILAVGACAGPGVTGRPSGAGPSPAASSPVASAHGDVLTGSAAIGYVDLRDWMSGWKDVALVRIEAVGPSRWNSADGSRPSEAAVHGPPPDPNGDRFLIGRLVDVRLVRTYRGRWTTDELATYFSPGGVLGGDRFDPELPDPSYETGQLAVAGLLQKPGDVGADGPVPVQVAWLFPITADRVLTLDPAEDVKIQDVPSMLP